MDTLAIIASIPPTGDPLPLFGGISAALLLVALGIFLFRNRKMR